MTSKDLLDRLVALFPEFRSRWDGPGNCFRNDDGVSSPHAVFAEFTHFFRGHHTILPAGRIAVLGELVSQCMASGDQDLSNAAATCFVENIAGEACARDLAQSFSGEAQKYWQSWVDPDSGPAGAPSIQ